jgi:hypothetical protein
MHIGGIDAPVKEDREAWLTKRAALTVVTAPKAAS